MVRPLNPHLYNALDRAYGDVHVTCEGEAFEGEWIWDRIERRWELNVEYAGEQYTVDCPKCGDTRHRLQFHHLWGVRDIPALPEIVEDGRRAGKRWGDLGIDPYKKHLVICFNEDCYGDGERRWGLYEYVHEFGGTARRRGRIRRGVKVAAAAKKVQPPGPLIRVNKLPFRHHAVEYLESRFYDIDRLANKYGVSYCQNSPYWLAKDRIIIPVQWDGALRSWQARVIGESPKGGPPKYFTCPNSSIGQWLYNLDRAKRWKTGVVCEGATDTWTYGPMSMAYFKQKLSSAQIKLLIKYFREGSIILLPDSGSEELERAKWAKERLDGKIRHGVALVELNGGDPGSLERNFLRSHTKKEAKAQGVKVWFERR